MTQPSAGPAPVYENEDEISVFSLASVLVRWRWTIVALGVFGGVLGLARGLTSPKVYKSTATFIPQGSEGGVSGLALAASQFGIRVPSGGDAWGPPVYV